MWGGAGRGAAVVVVVGGKAAGGEGSHGCREMMRVWHRGRPRRRTAQTLQSPQPLPPPTRCAREQVHKSVRYSSNAEPFLPCPPRPAQIRKQLAAACGANSDVVWSVLDEVSAPDTVRGGCDTDGYFRGECQACKQPQVRHRLME